MISIRNPRIENGIATAELNIKSACCTRCIKVIGFYDGKLFTEITNAENGCPIYIGLWQELISVWEDKLNEKKSC